MAKVVLRAPAEVEFVTPISRFVREVVERVTGCCREDSFDVMLAVQEACTNVVKHAYGEGRGDMEVHLVFSKGRVIVEVRDWGKGFDMDSLSDPDPFHPREGGYGIFIIKRIMDRIEYIRGGDFNALVFEKKIL